MHGPIEIPLFYLLSGYSLTLGYGRSNCSSVTSGSASSINYFKYLRNRFARIAPLYYFSFIFFIPAYIHINYWNPNPILVFSLTATCTNSWLFPKVLEMSPPFPPNIPAWTISTLFFFYLIFPGALKRFQQLNDDWLARMIVLLHMIQMLPFIYPWITVPPRIPRDGILYWNQDYLWFCYLITANPFLRFPGKLNKKL